MQAQALKDLDPENQRLTIHLTNELARIVTQSKQEKQQHPRGDDDQPDAKS